MLKLNCSGSTGSANVADFFASNVQNASEAPREHSVMSLSYFSRVRNRCELLLRMVIESNGKAGR